jgi:hypothetical protein
VNRGAVQPPAERQAQQTEAQQTEAQPARQASVQPARRTTVGQRLRQPEEAQPVRQAAVQLAEPALRLGAELQASRSARLPELQVLGQMPPASLRLRVPERPAER